MRGWKMRNLAVEMSRAHCAQTDQHSLRRSVDSCPRRFGCRGLTMQYVPGLVKSTTPCLSNRCLFTVLVIVCIASTLRADV